MDDHKAGTPGATEKRQQVGKTSWNPQSLRGDGWFRELYNLLVDVRIRMREGTGAKAVSRAWKLEPVPRGLGAKTPRGGSYAKAAGGFICSQRF